METAAPSTVFGLAAYNGEAHLAISILPIADLIKKKSFADADVYVFSKVYTGLAAVVMRRLQEEFGTAIAHFRDVLGEATYQSLARKGEAMTTETVTYAYDQSTNPEQS